MGFDLSAIANHLVTTTSPASAAPMTFGGRFKTTQSNYRRLFSLTKPGVDTDYFMLGQDQNGTATGKTAVVIKAASNSAYLNQSLSILMPQSIWCAADVCFDTTGSRSVMIDGGNKVSGSGLYVPAGVTAIAIGGRQGDFFYGVGGGVSHCYLYKRGLADVERAFIQLGGHVRNVAGLTCYWKMNRQANGKVPDEMGVQDLTIVGTMAATADDDNYSSYYTGADIADQVLQQNSAMTTLAVGAQYDTVSSAFTLQLYKVAAAAVGTLTLINAATASRVISVNTLTVTGGTSVAPGDYVTCGSGALARVLNVYGSAAPYTILVDKDQTFAAGAALSRYTAGPASVAGITLTGGNLGGTPTQSQPMTQNYFTRSICTADPTNVLVSDDSELFGIQVQALAVAPSFSQAPVVSATSSAGYTVSIVPNSGCTAFLVAVAAGAAQPTIPQIKAGTGLAATSKAIAGADTLTVTGLDFPLHDLWMVLNNAIGDSPVASLLAQAKSPPTNKVYRTFTSIAAGTRYAGNCAVGDVEETDIKLTPSGVLPTYSPDGNDAYAVDGRQQRTSRVWSLASRNWILDDAGQQLANVWYNDSPPVFQGSATRYAFAVGTPATYQLASLWSNPQSDQLQIQALQALPDGLSVVNGALTGNLVSNGVAAQYAFRATDLSGASGDGSILIVPGKRLVPDLYSLDYRDADQQITRSYLQWQNNFVDSNGPPDVVFGQDPAAMILVDADTVIKLTISRTPAGQVPTYGLIDHSFQATPSGNGDLDMHFPAGAPATPSGSRTIRPNSGGLGYGGTIISVRQKNLLLPSNPGGLGLSGGQPIVGRNAPGQPTFAQILIAGQNYQEQSVFNSATNDFTPQSINRLVPGWKSPAAGTVPATYQIWRSTDGGSTFTRYATISAAAAASAYAAYVSNSGLTTGASGNSNGPWPYLTNVDCAYVDTAATNCIGFPAGSGPDYYPGASYQYKVSAIDGNGIEGPLSDIDVTTYITNGVGIASAGYFNPAAGEGTITKVAGATPSGAANFTRMTSTSAFCIYLPYAGFATPHWNLNVKGRRYLTFNVRPQQAASTFQMLCLRVGDVPIKNAGGSQIVVQSTTYGTLTNGQWTAMKIALSDILTDYSSGSAVQQHAFYKIGIQDNAGAGGHVFDFDNFQFTSV